MRPERPENGEELEWAAAWQAHRARSALEANLNRAGLSEEAFWARYATWVAAMRGTYPGVLVERVAAYVTPADCVLDIGAGTGAFAIPLARVARLVTAIEPSPAQQAHLREAIGRSGARNIRVVQSRWEEVELLDLGNHSLVLAVHSLQMPDIAAALRKMCLMAGRCLLLVHTAGHSLSALSQELFDIEPGPDYRYLEHILRGLGFSPQVEFAEYYYEVPLEMQLEMLRYNPGLSARQCDEFKQHVLARGLATPDGDGLWLRRSYRDALISVISP